MYIEMARLARLLGSGFSDVCFYFLYVPDKYKLMQLLLQSLNISEESRLRSTPWNVIFSSCVYRTRLRVVPLSLSPCVTRKNIA